MGILLILLWFGIIFFLMWLYFYLNNNYFGILGMSLTQTFLYIVISFLIVGILFLGLDCYFTKTERGQKEMPEWNNMLENSEKADYVFIPMYIYK